jgi:uncharacterized protein (TIGR02246 family)
MNTNRESEVESLYKALLDRWNHHDAAGFASLFDENGHTVGFDGSMYDGRAEIEASLRHIFEDHVTARYVAKVREVFFLSPEVAVLRAVSGLVPPGKTEINPATNAIQTLVAVLRDSRWQIAMFQNTPAQFHGRPQLAQQLTEELRQILENNS